MVKFKNIELFFQSDCCNKTVNRSTEDRAIDSPLVESMPDPPKNLLDIYNKFESMNHLDLQEICVTFKSKYHKMNTGYLHNNFKKWFVKWIKKHLYFKPTYIMIPEFTKAGVIHYHGIIYFDNANDYWTAEIKRLCNNKWGRTQGKKIYNIENYWKYITKDITKQKFSIKMFTNVLCELVVHPREEMNDSNRSRMPKAEDPDSIHSLDPGVDIPSAAVSSKAARSLEQPKHRRLIELE